MSWGYLAIGALVLLGLEMLTPITIFMWMAIGVAAASVASYLGMAWPDQLMLFLLGTSGSIATYFLKKPRRRPADVSDPASVLRGLPGLALGELAPKGRVHVADGSWNARSQDGGIIADGTPIVVTGHDGATLVVRPAVRPAEPDLSATGP